MWNYSNSLKRKKTISSNEQNIKGLEIFIICYIDKTMKEIINEKFGFVFKKCFFFVFFGVCGGVTLVPFLSSIYIWKFTKLFA